MTRVRSTGMSLEERLRFRSVANPTTGCIEWTGGRSADGYGRISVGNRPRPVHRVSWEVHRGPIPVGLQIDHLCRNRVCLNPDHLEPVTQRINALRGVGVGAKNASKTHCVAGHPFNDANTYYLPDGRRQCRRCNTEAVLRYRKKRGAP